MLNLLVVHPPPANGLIEVRGEAWDVQPFTSGAQHPLLLSLDSNALRPRRMLKLTPPEWSTTVLDSKDGPLIVAGEHDGRKAVVLAFDPFASQLARLTSFPLLVSNVVEYLSGTTVEPFISTDMAVQIRGPAGWSQGTLTRPDGAKLDIPAHDSVATLQPANLVGRYVLSQELSTGDQAVRSSFVNLLSESGSELTPRALADLPGDAVLGNDDTPTPIPYEALVAVLALLVTLEWLHASRHA
jgi:hypothetical protein